MAKKGNKQLANQNATKQQNSNFVSQNKERENYNKESVSANKETQNQNKETKSDNPISKYIFWALATLGLILMVVLSQSAGTSGDEFFHYGQAQKVYQYYATGGADSSAAVVTPQYNLPYYGQSVDNFAYFVTNTLNIHDYMAMRHAINSIMGWLAMLFVGLFVKRVAGWRAAIIGLVLMYVSPRFIGHSFNNLKDLPLATGVIMSIYYITKFLDELPHRKWSTMIMLAISMAFAISVRVGGLIVIAYFALFAIIYYIWKYKILKKEFSKALLWSLGIVIVGYILAIITWPFGLQHPIDNPKETLSAMTKFAISLRQVFEGSSQWSDALPWYYTPKFILMTVPMVVLCASVLGVVSMFTVDKKKWFYYFVALFTFVFPVFWIIVNKSNVYGGWRHAMFTYPSLVCLAALGINSIVEKTKSKYIKAIVFCAFGVLCINPLSFCIRNHPYEYTYFNEFEGGIKNAYGKYEIDYYYHSIDEACRWVQKNAKKDALTTGNKIIVACWHIEPVDYYFRNDTTHFQTAFIRYDEMGASDWDYAIVCVTGIAPEMLQNHSFPPKNTVHEIKVDGVPICVVLKRQDKNDWHATQFKDAKQFDKALPLYQKALMADRYNISANLNLSEIYLMSNRPDSVTILSNNILTLNPHHEGALYFKAYALFLQNKSQEALNICEQMIKANFKSQNAYTLAANIKLKANDIIGAQGYLERLIDIDRIDNASVGTLIRIYQAQGLDEKNAYVKLYSLLANHADKIGNKEQSDYYNGLIKQIYGSGN